MLPTPSIMASLFKRGDWYYLSFYDTNQRPKRKQVSLKTRSKRTAERLRGRLEDAYALGEYSPWDDDEADDPDPQANAFDLTQLSGAIAGFMASRANLRPSTIKKYRDVLRLFQAFLGAGFATRRITTQHVEQFLRGGDRKPITKKTYSTALSPMFNWLIGQDVIVHNPVRDIRLERVPTKFPKYLTPDDVERLCAAILESSSGGQWLIDVIQANVYLGLRLSELVNVQWEHVDLPGRTLTVRNTERFSTKSGKERTVPLCAAAWDLLASLNERRDDRGGDEDQEYVFLSARDVQLSKQYTSRRFAHYARQVGLEATNFHATRHTAASWLAEQGCGIEAIRRYMGHSTIAVTQKYMHLSPDGFADQIDRAFSGI